MTPWDILLALAVVGLGLAFSIMQRRDRRRAAAFRQEVGTQLLAMQFALWSAQAAHVERPSREPPRQASEYLS